ncbi:MAG: oligosaccharide flippase family protein [Lachnospiraceae bacterium]|nr:oligosaccharide flippase family protein [Lachnospiraceae bacterium]
MKNQIQFREKRDPLINSGFIAIILCLIFRILLMKIIGAEGVAYFAPVNEVFILCIAFFNIGFSEALSNMMKYRIKREQYRNAHRIFRIAYTLTIGLSVLVAVLIFIFNNFITEAVFLQHLSKMALLMIAPAIVVMAFTCLLRGYFKGMGSPYPSTHSLVVEQIFTLVLGSFFAALFVTYGEKVAAVLRDNSFALSYGALGAAFGITLASIIALLHLLVIYFMYRGTIKRQIYRDSTRQMETPGYIYQSLLFAAVPTGVFVVLYQLNNLIDQRLFYYYFNKLTEENSYIFTKAEIWGNYYGIFLVVTGILTACVSMIFMKAVRTISTAWLREEQPGAREKLMQTITSMAIMAIPIAVMIAVLAFPIASLLDIANDEITVKLLQSGSVLIVLYAFSYFWFDLLKQFKRTFQMLVLAGSALAVHILAIIGIMQFINNAEQLILGVIAGNIVGALFSFVLGFILVMRMLKYQGEMVNKNLRTVVITLLCSAIIGLMALFLSRGIINLVGPAVTLLVCLTVSIIAFFVLMMLLRGLTFNELDRIPGGQYLIRLGRLFRFYG